MRLVVVAIFTVPAAFAGYQVGIGFGGQLIGQGTLLTLTSVLSGLVAALSAWRSLALPVGADGGATPRSGGSSAPPPASAD